MQTAQSLLPLIPLFPLLGFLINGFLYLISHSKLGSKDAPLGAHGAGHGDEGGHGGHQPHMAERDRGGHGGQTHDPAHPTADAHGHGHAAEEHAHHEIPFARAHSLVGPVATGLSCVTAFIAIFVITVAAGEAAIGLAIIISLYRLKGSVNLDDAAEMKG